MFLRPGYESQLFPFLHNKEMYKNLNFWLSIIVWKKDMYICVYLYIYTYRHVYRHICMYVCMYVYVYEHIYIYICTYVYTDVYMCICMYIYIHVYMSIYKHIYISRGAVLGAAVLILPQIKLKLQFSKKEKERNHKSQAWILCYRRHFYQKYRKTRRRN